MNNQVNQINTELVDKYTKLNWEFQFSNGGDVFFKSPRLFQLEFLCPDFEWPDMNETHLLNLESYYIFKHMREKLNAEFDKVVDDIMRQQVIIMNHTGQPEKLIKVSFEVRFG